MGVIFTGLLSLQIGGTRVSFLGNHNGDCLRALQSSHNQIRGMIAPPVPHPPGKQHPLQHPSPAPFPRGLPQGSNPGVSQALKDQAVRVPTWSRKLKLSSELPRTAVAGVLRLGEQLAPASLPWRTPPARPAPASTPCACAPRRTRGENRLQIYRHLGLWLEHREETGPRQKETDPL